MAKLLVYCPSESVAESWADCIRMVAPRAEVDAARSIEDAQQRAGSGYDLVLIGATLVDGQKSFRLAGDIRKRCPGVPVYLVGGSDNRDTVRHLRRKAGEAGAGYIAHRDFVDAMLAMLPLLRRYR